MHRLEYHRRAQRALRRIPKQRAAQILDRLEQLAESVDPCQHPNVKAMQGNWSGNWRLRVGEYRVIFEIRDIDGEVEVKIIYVNAIGSRGDVYG